VRPGSRRGAGRHSPDDARNRGMLDPLPAGGTPAGPGLIMPIGFRLA